MISETPTDTQKKLLSAIPEGWQGVLASEVIKPYFAQLSGFVSADRKAGFQIYPPRDLVFNSLKQTSLEQVHVVILGQDPYHQPRQAQGLSFSVPEGVPLPPSLRNIYKELTDDLQVAPPENGSLLPWAKQGVLLLNTLLTVREGEPLSHQGKGWELFTDTVIEAVLKKKDPVVFLLWGRLAREKVFQLRSAIPHQHHLFLTAPHPSPLSAHRGFLGCKHFSKTNQFLQSINKPPIQWV